LPAGKDPDNIRPIKFCGSTLSRIFGKISSSNCKENEKITFRNPAVQN
jgi:hypothetical protein